MQNLKRNNFSIIMGLLTFAGCSTSNYKVLHESRGLTEILVRSDRVIVECEFQDNYTGDMKDPHGFMIHFVDDENTVTSIISNNVLDREDCQKNLVGVQKVLNDSKEVYFGARGEVSEVPRRKTDRNYTFKNLGTFNNNGRVLNFETIWNKSETCYQAGYGHKKPCPRGDFPMTQ